MPERSSITLDAAERDLVLSLLAAQTPKSTVEGEWTPSDVLDEWPEDEYRQAWINLGDKLRSPNADAPPASVGGLLARSREILAELRLLGVLRTDNAPAGDYAEWLVKTASGGELQTNSNESYDVLTPSSHSYPGGERIQVKARSLSDPEKAGQRQLSIFRSWSFDSCVAVLFDDTFGVRHAARLPMEEVKGRASWNEHVNGWRVRATDEFLAAGEDWTQRLNEAAAKSR